NRRDIARSLGMYGSDLHAGKVRLEPLEVNDFGSTGHASDPGPYLIYFLTVNSTVAVAALTSTGCVVGLPSSLQVFRVYLPAGIFLISKLPSLSVTAKYGVGTTTT